MPPIRVLQIMPAMDAGGMETFVPMSTVPWTAARYSLTFCTTMISPAFMMLKLKPWAGTLPS